MIEIEGVSAGVTYVTRLNALPSSLYSLSDFLPQSVCIDPVSAKLLLLNIRTGPVGL